MFSVPNIDLHRQQSCYPSRPFSRALSPGVLVDHRRAQNVSSLMNGKTKSDGHLLPRARVLPRVQPRRQGDGSSCSLARGICLWPPPSSWLLSPGLLLTLPPGSGGVLSVGSDQPPMPPSTHCGCVRGRICAFTSQAISSVLLSKKMKYLVLRSGIYGNIFPNWFIKSTWDLHLADVKEISGSSAGAILALIFSSWGCRWTKYLDTITYHWIYPQLC